LPLLGRIISKDKKAYKYLTNSVNAFPSKKIFLKKLEEIGFKDCKHTPLTFGIVSLYSAKK
jgi:demethylmenaquinone methyltransferase/2-methoxy-6-polyprenyl-1,4-benzoquinol methylase